MKTIKNFQPTAFQDVKPVFAEKNVLLEVKMGHQHHHEEA